MTFGETIRELREANKLTKRETATYAKCSPTYIAKIEKENVIPGDEIIIRLANLFKYNKKKLLFLAKKESTVPEAKKLFETQLEIFEKELINDYFLTIVTLSPADYNTDDVPLMDTAKKRALAKKVWEEIDTHYSTNMDERFILFYHSNIHISDYLNKSLKSMDIIKTLKKMIESIEYNIHDDKVTVYFIAPEKTQVHSNVEPANLGALTSIPLLTWVQAGEMTDYSDKYPYAGCSDEYISTDLRGDHLFALRVKGDSMTPKFLEDDIVIVDPDQHPENGSFVVIANIDTNETTLKQLKIYSNDLMVLHPLNPVYSDTEFCNCHKIVGRVVRKQTNF